MSAPRPQWHGRPGDDPRTGVSSDSHQHDRNGPAPRGVPALHRLRSGRGQSGHPGLAVVAVEFAPEQDVADLAERTAAFVREVVIPVEDAHRGTTYSDALRADLQQAAKDAGLFAPHVSVEYGGHGLDMRGRAAVFEEAGYSLLGPLALNIAAPDEGNMHLLEAIATPQQKEGYLRPLTSGQVRSCFAMTEPAPGAGSDPAALTTRAKRVRDGWQIDGHKWFITGAVGAAYTIC